MAMNLITTRLVDNSACTLALVSSGYSTDDFYDTVQKLRHEINEHFINFENPSIVDCIKFIPIKLHAYRVPELRLTISAVHRRFEGIFQTYSMDDPLKVFILKLHQLAFMQIASDQFAVPVTIVDCRRGNDAAVDLL